MRNNFIEINGQKILPEHIDIVLIKKKKQLSPAYLQDREQVWALYQERSLQEGWHLHNGSVYTIEEFREIESGTQIVMGMCEYKDIIFKLHRGHLSVIEQYGKEHAFNHIVVAGILMTKDDKFIFGERKASKDKEKGTIDMIGGTLNADEMSVATFSDFAAFFVREVYEETGLRVQPGETKLITIHHYSGKFEFVYLVKLNQLSAHLHLNPTNDEFERILTLSIETLVEIDYPLDETVKQCIPYLRSLRQ